MIDNQNYTLTGISDALHTVERLFLNTNKRPPCIDTLISFVEQSGIASHFLSPRYLQLGSDLVKLYIDHLSSIAARTDKDTHSFLTIAVDDFLKNIEGHHFKTVQDLCAVLGLRESCTKVTRHDD